jgi:hypothetical protein
LFHNETKFPLLVAPVAGWLQATHERAKRSAQRDAGSPVKCQPFHIRFFVFSSNPSLASAEITQLYGCDFSSARS